MNDRGFAEGARGRKWTEELLVLGVDTVTVGGCRETWYWKNVSGVLENKTRVTHQLSPCKGRV